MDCSNEDAAAALAHAHPKSAPVELHKGADEGPRNGISHLNEHSTRVRAAHAAMGTALKPKKVGP